MPAAVRDLRRLDPPVRRRVRLALERFATDGYGDVRAIAASEPPQERLRVGDWRVRFVRDDDERVLEILRVLPRGRAYRG